MASNTVYAATFFAVLCVVVLPSASAHNITRILSQYPEFGQFNALLSQSKVAEEINRRQTITVMAVDNGSASAFSGLEADTLQKALSIHVILDYYDDAKLSTLAKNTTLLTTLFQSSGVANDRMGFLNYTRRKADGKLLFGTAEPGSPLSSAFVKVVAVRPYNISVIQVTNAIVPPGLGGNPQPVPVAPTTPPPAAAPKASSSPADSPAADSPDTSADAPSPAADVPVADSPAADSPAASPADSPANSPATASTADGPAGSNDEADKSSAGQVVAGAAAGLFGALVVLGALW